MKITLEKYLKLLNFSSLKNNRKITTKTPLGKFAYKIFSVLNNNTEDRAAKWFQIMLDFDKIFKKKL
jgi:hypothetical protein